MKKLYTAAVLASVLAILMVFFPQAITYAENKIRGSQIIDHTVTITQLNTTGVTGASYGDQSNVGTFTVGADGRLTAASNTLLGGSVTKGNVLAASGTAWNALAVGADGTVLTADTASTNGVKWAAASGGGGSGGGGGAMVLLETHTASSSAQIDFTSFSSQYDDYVIEYMNVLPATDNVSFELLMSTDGGATFDTTAGHYKYASYLTNDTGSFSTNTVGSNSAAFIQLAANLDNTAADGTSGTMHLYNPQQTASFHAVNSDFFYMNNDTNRYRGMMSGIFAQTTAYNAVRFKMSSGNVTSGTFRLYGIMNAASASSSAVGALTLLESHSASSSASLAFTQLSTTYDEYVFEFVGIVPATDNAVLWMRMSTNGGATYDSGNNYSNANFSFQEAASGVGGGGTAQSKIIVNGGVTNTANYSASGSVKFYNNPSIFKQVIGTTMGRFSSGDTHRVQWAVHGQYDSTTAVNAVQFLESTGNITSGTIRMYGVSNVVGSGAGAAGKVLLEKHTASTSAQLDFTTCISSSYDDYEFEMLNVLPATDNVDLQLRVSTDGGATFDSTSNYWYAVNFAGSQNTGGTAAGEAQAAMKVGWSGISNTSSGLSGTLRLFNPGSAVAKQFTGQNTFLANDAHRYILNHFGTWNQTTAVNAVRFFMSSGNITSGTIRCYGLGK